MPPQMPDGAPWPHPARKAAWRMRTCGAQERAVRSGGLRGLWLPVPDGAVGHDVAAGALPLDLAAFELLLVQRRVHAILAQQGAVGAGFDHASGVDDVDDVGVDDGGQAMGDGDGGP